jgi:hypothetical protein
MFRKSNHYLVLFAVLAVICLTAGIATAAPVTQSITYQGKLTNAAGSPLTGTYSVTFIIYDDGGTALSTDTHSVMATNGLFTTPIAVSQQFFEGRRLWLGIKVGTDPEMTPRQEIRPVPFALSLRPGAILHGSDNTPVLTVIKDGSPGFGMNVTTSATNNHGVYARTSGYLSNGLYAYTTGDYSYGVEALTTGSRSFGMHASTSGPYGYGVYAQTSGSNSYGLYTLTSGSSSPGVYASTTNASSHGVYVRTSGSGSRGIDVSTTNLKSDGVNVQTSGDASKGVNVSTTGYNSSGVAAETYNEFSNGVMGSTAGENSNGVFGYTTGNRSIGVYAQTHGNQSDGVYALTKGTDSDGVVAITTNTNSDGVQVSTSGYQSQGVIISTTNTRSNGVQVTTSGYSSHGVYASTINSDSHGLYANTSGRTSYGVYATTSGSDSPGVRVSTSNSGSPGVHAWTFGLRSDGVYAQAEGPVAYGVLASSTQSSGVYAATGKSDHKYGVQTPDIIRALGYETGTSDVAEYIPVWGDVSPGTVLVIGPDSRLTPSTSAYDTGVAGIVSTSPGISLGAKEEGNYGEALIAVAGRVPCRVDASNGPIHPRDLLTTSDNPGHAMKAKPIEVNGQTFYPSGIVLGKAMGTLESGTGTIEVLVTLQ